MPAPQTSPDVSTMALMLGGVVDLDDDGECVMRLIAGSYRLIDIALYLENARDKARARRASVADRYVRELIALAPPQAVARRKMKVRR